MTRLKNGWTPEQIVNPIDDLTKRKEEILRLVATGQSNKEVADALSLQENMIKLYMTIFLSKLHARNRVEAALIAHKAWNTNAGLGYSLKRFSRVMYSRVARRDAIALPYLSVSK